LRDRAQAADSDFRSGRSRWGWDGSAVFAVFFSKKCLTAVNYMKNDYPLDEFMALLEDIRNAG
jgi:hypothetical protein